MRRAWTRFGEKRKSKMAEHNKIQLFSNYDSLIKVKSKELQDCGEPPATSSRGQITRSSRLRKCQKTRCSNYGWPRTSKAFSSNLLIAAENHTATTTTTNSSQISLITNHHLVMKSSNDDDKLFDSIERRRRRHDSSLGRRRRGSISVYQIKPLTIALLLTIGVLLRASVGSAFTLDGTQNSFAQFRKWYSGLNGTLELEFKTEQPNGLLLYTDDGGTYDFFELKLVEGVLRLRYNLGGGAQIITVGRDLHDGHWHKVQVSAAAEQTNKIMKYCVA